MQRYGHFIDGRQQPPIAGCWLETINPYNGQAWAEIARGDVADAEAAVEAAARAFPAWRATPPAGRAAILRRFADLVEQHAAELGALESRDNGKLLAETGLQCRLLPSWIHYFAGLADKIEGRIPPIEKANTLGFVHYEPYGVCVGIVPWNSPLLLLVWKLAPALVAGNTFVAKPSEYTTATAVRLAEIAVEAGLPPGVFNVVSGLGEEVGASLIGHPKVRRVAFTGGEAGGLAVQRLAGEKLIPCTLELGGKSANVVFEDADREAALSGAISGIFAAGGQSCMAGSRLLLHDSLHDLFVERLVAAAEAVKLGDPSDPATNMGPVATPPQHRKILDYIAIAEREGARRLTGGLPQENPGGLFVRPTVLVDVKPSMRIAREEVFGPVVAVLRFSTEEEAIALANDSAYGLAAGIWTEDMRRAFRVSAALEAGTVWINTYRSTSYVMPFGGYKRSGLGRENGIESIKDWLQQKSVHLNLGKGPVANPFVRR